MLRFITETRSYLHIHLLVTSNLQTNIRLFNLVLKPSLIPTASALLCQQYGILPFLLLHLLKPLLHSRQIQELLFWFCLYHTYRLSTTIMSIPD